MGNKVNDLCECARGIADSFFDIGGGEKSYHCVECAAEVMVHCLTEETMPGLIIHVASDADYDT